MHLLPNIWRKLIPRVCAWYPFSRYEEMASALVKASKHHHLAGIGGHDQALAPTVAICYCETLLQVADFGMSATRETSSAVTTTGSITSTVGLCLVVSRIDVEGLSNHLSLNSLVDLTPSFELRSIWAKMRDRVACEKEGGMGCLVSQSDEVSFSVSQELDSTKIV